MWRMDGVDVMDLRRRETGGATILSEHLSDPMLDMVFICQLSQEHPTKEAFCETSPYANPLGEARRTTSMSSLWNSATRVDM